MECNYLRMLCSENYYLKKGTWKSALVVFTCWWFKKNTVESIKHFKSFAWNISNKKSSAFNVLPDMSVVCIPKRTADDTIPKTVLQNSVLVRLDSGVKLSSVPQPTIQPLGKYVNKLIWPWTKWMQFGRPQFPTPFWMKMTELQFEFHWNLFPGAQLTTSQHWFR